MTEIQGICRNTLSGFALIDRYETVLYTDGTIRIPDNVISNAGSSGIISSVNGTYFIDVVQTNLWAAVSFASDASLSSSYRGYLIATILLFVILVLLTILLITPTIYKILSPINILSNTMWKVADGDLSRIPEFKTNDEIGDLSTSRRIVCKSKPMVELQ